VRRFLASTLGRFFFRYRNALFPLLFLACVLLVRPGYFFENRAVAYSVDALGALVVLLGESVRILVIGLVYIRRGGHRGRVFAHGLVTEGIYAHVRNPMYLGNILIALGVCLLYGSPRLLAIAFPFFLLVYWTITLEEESYLEDRFGEAYLEYRNGTPRILPRLSGLSTTMEQYSFNWRRVVHQEYGTFFATLGGVYALLVLKYLYSHEWAVQRPYAVGAPFLVLLVGYCWSRWLKKSGRLQPDRV